MSNENDTDLSAHVNRVLSELDLNPAQWISVARYAMSHVAPHSTYLEQIVQRALRDVDDAELAIRLLNNKGEYPL